MRDERTSAAEPNSIRERNDSGQVEVRTLPVSREQMKAIGQLASVARRIAVGYEVYGGVYVKDALAHLATFEGEWYDAADTARLEQGHRPTPEEE